MRCGGAGGQWGGAVILCRARAGRPEGAREGARSAMCAGRASRPSPQIAHLTRKPSGISTLILTDEFFDCALCW